MKQKRIAGRATNPRQRVLGGEFEQLVQELCRQRDAKKQRQQTGFGPEAVLFLNAPRPKKRPLALLFSSPRR